MFDTMKIAKIIKEARMKKNMTQMNLADCLGVSYQAVSNWERGNSMPDIAKLEDLCKALDLTVEELLGMETKAAAAVEKVIQQEPLTGEELAEVAPILPPETVKEQVSGKKYSIAALSEIAPFLDDEVLEEMVNELEVESLTLLTCIAPFLSEKTLEKLVCRAPADDFDGIGAMAPFLSDRALEQLAQKYADSLDENMMQSLIHFLSDGALDRLVEDRIAKDKTADLFRLYPFLSQKTLKKLVKHLMESGDLDEAKKAAMYL